MNRGLFIDFNDSFSYNILSEFYLLDEKLDIINIDQLNDSYMSYCFYVFGPGPGHVADYKQYFKFIQKIINKPSPKLFICLGHQIFWYLKGAKIIESVNIKHGQTEDLFLSKNLQKKLGFSLNELKVQRYNSLSVKLSNLNIDNNTMAFNSDQELMLALGKDYLSYQFHPESIGTIFRSQYFRYFIKNYLY